MASWLVVDTNTNCIVWLHLQDEKYDHIPEEEIKKVEKWLKEKDKWFNEKLNAQNQLAINQNPVVLADQILTEKKVM